MTFEGWSDSVRTVMQEKPLSWIFFVTYILIAMFSAFNLFIAVIVDAMPRNHAEDTEDEQGKSDIINKKLDFMMEKMNNIKKTI